ncbi:hypothetical protein TNCV_3051221 [Trichonephila clavipes]|nr:hypothetical protein TNCV_3051221 [Trichonephila clavipes]
MKKIPRVPVWVGVLGKTKFLVHFRIVRAPVSPSGEETRCQNCIVVIDIHLYGATLKSDTSSRENVLGLQW